MCFLPYMTFLYDTRYLLTNHVDISQSASNRLFIIYFNWVMIGLASPIYVRLWVIKFLPVKKCVFLSYRIFLYDTRYLLTNHVVISQSVSNRLFIIYVNWVMIGLTSPIYVRLWVIKFLPAKKNVIFYHIGYFYTTQGTY